MELHISEFVFKFTRRLEKYHSNTQHSIDINRITALAVLLASMYLYIHPSSGVCTSTSARSFESPFPRALLALLGMNGTGVSHGVPQSGRLLSRPCDRHPRACLNPVVSICVRDDIPPHVIPDMSRVLVHAAPQACVQTRPQLKPAQQLCASWSLFFLFAG